jgi:hypothetical protein
MNVYLHKRNVLLVLVGVASLPVKERFADSVGELLYSYLGNLTVSFAFYFVVSIGAWSGLTRVGIAAIALVVVEGFELTNGFGVMTNVYDPFDYLANALGVVLAYFIEVISARVFPTAPANP